MTEAPARRAVIDLGADATILDAARRLSEVDSPDVVLVVPAGAPLVRNAVFLDVLRRRAGDRRLVLVSSDARARSLAGAVHLRSFSSLSALDRHELDATEHLSDVRRKALTKVVAPGGRRGISVGRRLAVFTSLLAAALILLAVVAPTATIVVAGTPSPLGPFEYDLRAGPQGDIRATTLIDDKVTATIKGTATDSRDARVRATGFEKFTNMTTNDIRIPSGTVVQTTDNPPIKFQTIQEKVLPRSTLLPVIGISTVTIPIEALEVGTRGNVGADKITQDSSPDYMVTNPAATTGGEDKRIPLVKLSDYETAVASADRDPNVKTAAENRVKDWKAKAPKGMSVYGYTWLRTGASPASDVVGHEGEDTFEITVTGTVTAYQVAENEPSATALDRLKHEVPSGLELALNSGVVTPVIGPSIASDGIHWRVQAKGQQVPRPNTAQMTAALAGRSFDEIKPILTDRLGFQVQGYSRWPEWWPRLPVLDSRIKIEITSATSASPP